jgi:hypothetical protein
MSQGRPLALSDTALNAVIESAKALPVQWRGRLLSNLADALTLRDEVDDIEVQRVLNELVARMRAA